MRAFVPTLSTHAEGDKTSPGGGSEASSQTSSLHSLPQLQRLSPQEPRVVQKESEPHTRQKAEAQVDPEEGTDEGEGTRRLDLRNGALPHGAQSQLASSSKRMLVEALWWLLMMGFVFSALLMLCALTFVLRGATGT